MRNVGGGAPTTNRVGQGIAIALVPILFGIGYAQLATAFDYPKILRQPALEILSRYRDHQTEIAPYWWLMFLAAVVFAPVATALPRWLGLVGSRATVAQTVGLLASIVQLLGLSRWVFAVPLLARQAANPTDQRVAAQIFELIHEWFGVGLGEWLGYLFTASWTALIAWSLLRRFRGLAISGFVIALGIAAGLMEAFGVAAAGPINAIAYSLWVIWMIGIAIITATAKPDRFLDSQQKS